VKRSRTIAIIAIILIIALGSVSYAVFRLQTETVVTTSSSSTTTGTVSSSIVLTNSSSSLTTINSSVASSAAQLSNLGQKFVEIKAFDAIRGNLQFIAGSDYTATQLLTLVQDIHGAIGNFNLIRFIRTECFDGVVNGSWTASQIQSMNYSVNGTSPNLNYNWNGTLNSYFTAVQKAAGGQIIPDADMDVYFGAPDCNVGAQPQYFYQDSASLLNLSAISGGERYLMLESWDAAHSQTHDPFPDQSTVLTFFQTLQAQGWRYFIPQVNNPGATSQGPTSCSASNFQDYDYNYASYLRTGLFWVNTTYPYVFPHFDLVCSLAQAEPYLSGILLGIESQQQQGQSAYCGGQYPSAGSSFEGCLTFSQRETALTYLAGNQSNYNYIFIYPVLIGEHSVEYDANRDGTLPLMEQLINQYN
jgi:hypothetical protein